LKNDGEQNSVLLEMSGQGCRQFETSSNMGFMQLFCEVYNGDFNITRLDIAYDDIDHEGSGLLDIKKVGRYTLHQRFVTIAIPQIFTPQSKRKTNPYNHWG